jgi:hypothetical protein
MAREKGYFTNVSRFYRWQTFDHICFGYVQGLQRALPSLSVTDALKQFLDDFGLCEDVYCFDNAKAAYYRIRKSLMEIEMGFSEA